jgi:predicted nucleic acid-binding protein
VKILLDTNIIIDVLSKREKYEHSLALIKYCELGKAEGLVSTTTVTDVMYIMGKHMSSTHIRDAVQTLLIIIDVANVLKRDITVAFSSEMQDYEDAVQAACAMRIGAKYIVTNNLKDFVKSPVPAVSPKAMLDILNA